MSKGNKCTDLKAFVRYVVSNSVSRNAIDSKVLSLAADIAIQTDVDEGLVHLRLVKGSYLI